VNLLQGYLKLLTCGDEGREIAATKAYHFCVGAITRMVPEPEDGVKSPDNGRAAARLECYCLVAFARLSYEHYLGEEAIAKTPHVPCTIVQGQYDPYYTPGAACGIHNALPRSRLF